MEVAQLVYAPTLHVAGHLNMKCLREGYKYEVKFFLMIMGPCRRFHPITFSLVLPSGEPPQETELDVENIKPKHWVEVMIGDFVATDEDGDIDFLLADKDKQFIWNNNDVGGLIVAGVLIQPAI